MDEKHCFCESLTLSEVSGADPKLSLTKLYSSEDEEERKGRGGDEAEVSRVGGGGTHLD